MHVFLCFLSVPEWNLTELQTSYSRLATLVSQFKTANISGSLRPRRSHLEDLKVLSSEMDQAEIRLIR